MQTPQAPCVNVQALTHTCILIVVKRSGPLRPNQHSGKQLRSYFARVVLPADPCDGRRLANCRHPAVGCILQPSPSAKALPLAAYRALARGTAAGSMLSGAGLATLVAAAASRHCDGILCSVPLDRAASDARRQAVQRGSVWLGMQPCWIRRQLYWIRRHSEVMVVTPLGGTAWAKFDWASRVEWGCC
jgi:hypothetical protein